MGISLSKIERPRLDFNRRADATTSAKESRDLHSEIEKWEKIYQERFARRLIFPWGTREPLWDMLQKPDLKPDEWRFKQANSSHQSKFTTLRRAGPTPEAIDTELEVRARQESLHSYHKQMMFARITPHIMDTWSPKGTIGPDHVPYLSHGDTLPFRLHGKDLIHPPWLNQTTAVYFEPDFMRCYYGNIWWDRANTLDFYWGDGYAQIARALLRAWLDVHDNHGETPNFQQSRYFAKPILLEGRPGHRGATDDTIHTHKAICEALQDAQNKPVSSKDPSTWVEHGCEIGPIFRSIIIVVDKQLALRQGWDPAGQRRIFFDECTVLLVRTGDEDHLSAPIDLSELTAASLDLPLDRNDAAMSGSNHRQQVIRVQLRTAVRFIMNLERRERNASARLTAMKKVLDAESFRDADAWVSGILAP